MFPFAWRNFHHKPALVAPIILWLEYFLCAHHTIFPKFQLLGTCVDPPGPTFCLPGPSWLAHHLAHPSTHLCTPPCTSAHLCAPLCNFRASLSRASHPYWTFHFDHGPIWLPWATQPSCNLSQCPPFALLGIKA